MRTIGRRGILASLLSNAGLFGFEIPSHSRFNHDHGLAMCPARGIDKMLSSHEPRPSPTPGKLVENP